MYGSSQTYTTECKGELGTNADYGNGGGEGVEDTNFKI
jgi:hypothetical protein